MSVCVSACVVHFWSVVLRRHVVAFADAMIPVGIFSGLTQPLLQHCKRFS